MATDLVKPITFLFAPGAGAPSTSRWMQHYAKLLSTLGSVETFDYPYMEAGQKRPDRPEVLIAAHREKLAALRAKSRGPLVLVGKSMGSRIGCHVSLVEEVAALVCFGYPLRAAGKEGKLRDQVLLELARPILFVQGTRDPLCPLDLLEQVRARMKSPNECHLIEGGNHSIEVGVRDLARTGRTQAGIEEGVMARVATFVAEHANRAPK